jgi:hypothetical protein
MQTAQAVSLVSRRNLIRCLLMLSLAASLLGARQTPLVDPDPIDVPPGMSIEKVASVIESAILKRRWWVDKQEAGRMVVIQLVQGHRAKVAIAYDTKTVKIQYVSSEKLGYEAKADGSRFIHPRYLAWVENLRRDILRDLNAPPEQ